LIDPERGCGLTNLAVPGLRFSTQFPHLPEHRDTFSLGVELDQCSQCRFHRIGVGVVAVIEKLHAVDFLNLQTRFGQRCRGETCGTFLD
jgi:hypothetical protein